MRIYKRKKVCYLDYYYKGQRIRRAVGSSRRVAELLAKETELKIERGENLGLYDQPEILFRDFAAEYLEYSKTNKRPKSSGRDVTSLKWLIAAFGDCYLSDITPRDIERYKRQRLQKGGVQPGTVNREISCLKTMYNRGIEWGYIEDNPVRSVKLLKEPPARVRFLEKHEVDRLLEQCSSHLRPIVIMALYTGMRRGEILGLRWSDVNLGTRTITVPNSKTNESRFVPLLEPVRKELAKLSGKRRGDFVFTNGSGQPYGKVHKGFKSACRRAGIEDFRFHDLRHTCASILRMAGADLFTIAQLLGHKDLKTTQRYAHISSQHLRDTAELLSSYLAGPEQAQVKPTMDILPYRQHG